MHGRHRIMSWSVTQCHGPRLPAFAQDSMASGACVAGYWRLCDPREERGAKSTPPKGGPSGGAYCRITRSAASVRRNPLSSPSSFLAAAESWRTTTAAVRCGRWREGGRADCATQTDRQTDSPGRAPCLPACLPGAAAGAEWRASQGAASVTSVPCREAPHKGGPGPAPAPAPGPGPWPWPWPGQS